jgi:hypothetical protein
VELEFYLGEHFILVAVAVVLLHLELVQLLLKQVLVEMEQHHP